MATWPEKDFNPGPPTKTKVPGFHTKSHTQPERRGPKGEDTATRKNRKKNKQAFRKKMQKESRRINQRMDRAGEFSHKRF